MRKTQTYLAEAFGTFALVGIGSFAILSASAGGAALGIVSIALGFGLALLVGLYAFGEVSGGHFNPAVSLGMFLDRRISMNDMICAHNRRAALNFATSWSTSLCALKKKDSRAPNVSGERPAATAASQ